MILEVGLMMIRCLIQDLFSTSDAFDVLPSITQDSNTAFTCSLPASLLQGM